MEKRHFPVMVMIFFLSVSVFAEDIPRDASEKNELETKELGVLLGLGYLTLFAVGPYTGLDFEDKAPASSLMLGGSSAILMSGSILGTFFIEDMVLKGKDDLGSALVRGSLAGMAAGAAVGGLNFAYLFGIGEPTGVIQMNDPAFQSWYHAAGTGFLGGAAFGVISGAWIGLAEGFIFHMQRRAAKISSESSDT